jgi:hypothetical protein
MIGITKKPTARDVRITNKNNIKAIISIFKSTDLST